MFMAQATEWIAIILSGILVAVLIFLPLILAAARYLPEAPV